jgi:threonine/homoserine/homoserine lactone efflux protein
MSILDSISLFLVMIALAAIPSTSVALVVTRSVMLGISNGVAVSLGIVLGDLVFIGFAILGLSAIAEAMGTFFVVVRCLGGAYLLWIGYSLLTAKGSPTYTISEATLNGNLFVSFLSGFFLTLGDIKAIVFYLSLLPAFIDLAFVSTADLLTILFITVVAVGGVKIAYAIAARKFAKLTQGKKLRKGTRNVAGSFMIGAGSYLILKA